MLLGRWLLLAPLLALLGAEPVAACRFRFDAPIPVRITAYVNERLEGIHPDYEWLVSDRIGEYLLYVLHLKVMTGNVLAGSINAAVDPYRVKFQLAGSEVALRKIRTASPRRQVVITGYLHFAGGARILMLDKVEAAAEPTAGATPALGSDWHQVLRRFHHKKAHPPIDPERSWCTRVESCTAG